MRNKVITALAATTLMTACASRHPGVSTPSTQTATSGSSSPATTAQQLCQSMFSSSRLLGWVDTDVGGLREYSYGGPVAHYPLRAAFTGTPARTRGAWCLLSNGPDSSSLWGAVDGRPPSRAMIVTGPGSGAFRGAMPNVPHVP